MTNLDESSRRRRYFELAIEGPAVLVTVALMVHVTANAVLRTFANDPLPHTLEYVQYWYLPIIAMLGFVAAQLRGQHVAADLLFEKLPAVTQRFVMTGVMVVCAATCAAFAWYGWSEALDAYDIRKTAGVTAVPAWPPYFLVPAVFASLTVQFSVASLRSSQSALGQPVADPEELEVLEQIAVSERGDR